MSGPRGRRRYGWGKGGGGGAGGGSIHLFDRLLSGSGGGFGEDSALWHSWGNIGASKRELSRVMAPLEVTTGFRLYLTLCP